MKLSSAIHQSYMGRRSGSFRGQLDETTPSSSTAKSLFWLVGHGLCCLVSLVLGFRFSRIIFFLLFSSSTSNSSPFRQLATDLVTVPLPELLLPSPPAVENRSKVVVGRHGIRIRPWPHPDPVEVMRAHRIIERVQREQRAQFGVKDPKTLVVVTPTYVRTFQTMHLTGLVHSLMLVPYDVVWIVVEAGGPTNETASLIAKSRVRVIHLGFPHRMPNSWDARNRLEAKMRLRALREVREQRLDGVVVFADDSNMHSMELFDEIQNVKWFGAVTVGILTHSRGDESSSVGLAEGVVKEDGEDEEKTSGLPVQGPACNASNQLVGWHTFNTLPYEGNKAVYIDDSATVLPGKLEWTGFVLNSRLLWKGEGVRPDWVKDLDEVDEDPESPLSLLKDPSMVEPLGSCGRQVLLWWLRVEARADSKFPPGWVIDPPLEITVASKRTPWPDAPPELPSTEQVVVNAQDVKHATKSRSPRSKRRSKRKHEPKVVDPQVSAKHP